MRCSMLSLGHTHNGRDPSRPSPELCRRRAAGRARRSGNTVIIPIVLASAVNAKIPTLDPPSIGTARTTANPFVRREA